MALIAIIFYQLSLIASATYVVIAANLCTSLMQTKVGFRIPLAFAYNM